MSTPIWIGDAKALSFGWYHPAIGDQREVGVVLCNPLGYEAMCTHRTYRLLAESLAKNGFPVVRFDYHGTGDSAGEDTDPGRLTAWKRSLNEANNALQRNSGLKKVCLFGLRFGATLALTVAAESTDIAAVIAWAPFTSGKAYMRELRAFNMIKGEEAEANNYLEASGFLLPNETVTELARVDLTTISKPPASAILVLQRDAASNEAKVGAHLAKLAANVTTEFVPGYELMMRDPHDAIVPEAVITRVNVWLAERFPGRSGAGIGGPLSLHDHPMSDVAEQPLFFGPTSQLFGILTTSPRWVRTRPMVLLLNTGSNHHVGSHRMSVTLARRLARLGFACFRFDIAGLGDSVLTDDERGKRHYAPDAIGDVHSAIAIMKAAVGIEKFIVVGLCSGAYLGFNTTVKTPSIIGQVIINLQPIIFSMENDFAAVKAATYKSNLHYKEMLFKPETYKRLFKGNVNVRGIATTVATRVVKRVKNRLRDTFKDSEAPRNEVEQAFFELVDRGTDSMLVFSSDDAGIDQLNEFLGDRLERLRARPNFHYRILDRADHTFTRYDARARLLDMLVTHINERFA